MENLRTALSLALIAGKHITIHTDDYSNCLVALKNVILPGVLADDMIEIDLQSYHTYEGLVSQMVKLRKGMRPELYKIVIWKNLEALDLSLRVKAGIIRVFDEIERFNMLGSRDVRRNTPIQFGDYSVTIPEIFLVAPVMVSGSELPKLHRQVKDRIWFCQSHHHTFNQEILATKISLDQIFKARDQLALVYANPEVQEYVCSLMVFTRSHRLCSLAPLTTRPSMRASEGIMLLAQALVAWTCLDKKNQLFVTPDYVKIAYRKIGYWIVDWETNHIFQGEGLELQKRTEISLLTGDWYGSEWPYVERYLDEFRADVDIRSTTGFTNKIVEDVLELVSPPL